jgi:uncharacterized protein YdeI (YjbR/CyaY-like superfamily)
MARTDPRVDAYIANAADFAKPILTQLRATVHAVCPDVEEAMKWSFPHFLYKGMLCSMAAFKEHAVFGFWKGSLVVGQGNGPDSMGQFGRLTKVSDLPSKKELIGCIKKAMALNDEGVTMPRAPRPARASLKVPAELAAALERNKKARTQFDGFSPSHKREYVEWIGEAKGEATRKRRVETAIEWMAQGKPRNWKYMRT